MDKQTEFLQSENWLTFQEATGKDVARFSSERFSANGIIHKLPLVGRYLYVPRGPIGEISNFQFPISKLIAEAKKRKMKWIRIEPQTDEDLNSIKKAAGKKIVKAPHDIQPQEMFVVDITQPEEELLAAMKPKTRYNIRLASKRGVKVFASRERKYRAAFLDLVTKTADRKGIVPHPRAYYEKLLAVLPQETGRLFVAEYEGRILTANLLIIFGASAIYLHGGSNDTHRDVMAPYLLQWEQIKFAKAQGCAHYDFGGVRTQVANRVLQITNPWVGITRFKMGFSPLTVPTIFPGAYDIILNPQAYFLYRRLYDLKKSLNYVRKFVIR